MVRIQTAQEVPTIYRWLAGQNLQGAIVELPFGIREDYQYTYFLTYHWLPILNRMSGFIAPTYIRLTSELKALPSQSGIQSLCAVGVRRIVVHIDRLPPHQELGWSKKSFVDAGLEIVAEFGSDVVYKVPPAQFTQQLQFELAVPDRLTAGEQLRLGLLAAGKGHELWTQQPLLEWTSARIEWQDLPAGRTTLSEQRVQLPLLIKADNVEQMRLSVRTPASPGDYLLKVYLPVLGSSPVSKPVRLSTDDFPTSRSSPRLVAATYTVEAPSPVIVSSPRVTISLKATNTGKAVWLATSKGDRGAVRLGWRWFKGDHEVPATSGRDIGYITV